MCSSSSAGRDGFPRDAWTESENAQFVQQNQDFPNLTKLNVELSGLVCRGKWAQKGNLGSQGTEDPLADPGREASR